MPTAGATPTPTSSPPTTSPSRPPSRGFAGPPPAVKGGFPVDRRTPEKWDRHRSCLAGASPIFPRSLRARGNRSQNGISRLLLDAWASRRVERPGVVQLRIADWNHFPIHDRSGNHEGGRGLRYSVTPGRRIRHRHRSSGPCPTTGVAEYRKTPATPKGPPLILSIVELIDPGSALRGLASLRPPPVPRLQLLGPRTRPGSRRGTGRRRRDSQPSAGVRGRTRSSAC